MIARSHRFHGHNSVRQAYHNGEVARAGFASVHYSINQRRKTYRVAVVVSKKVSKSAVVRNRIRRRVYEVIRVWAAALDVSYDIVVTIHGEQFATMPSAELTSTIGHLLTQVLEK